MKTILLMIPCCAALFVSGCTAGISRTGYQLSPAQTSTDLPERPIAIQSNVKYDTNDMVLLGSIHAYDTGFSLDCDEATILDVFRREGTALGADIINITEEKQPDPWTSSCYRAKAQFLRFKDREKAAGLVSDAKYAPEEIAKRVAAARKQNDKVMLGAVIGGVAGGVVGGVLGAAIASGTGDTNNGTNYLIAASPKAGKR
jgi:outer membrane lipoprotein SlyB